MARAPQAQLGIVVVIPSHDEPDATATVQSLWACERPRCAVEVIVVFNASAADDDSVREQNSRGLRALEAWRSRHEDASFHVELLDYPRLDSRHAGVGVARKLGMDAALLRLLSVRNVDGVIACLDADCRVDPDYLTALEARFGAWPPIGACSIYFEHPLEGPSDAALYDAARRYELHLRYYRHGLRHARFPHAHYTIGSCMAVRAETYASHGGMNRRQAGEDFYFLDKLMATHSVAELTSTRVIPGVRESSRTPFGTGRALRGGMALSEPAWQTYSPAVFEDLAALVGVVDALWTDADRAAAIVASLPTGVVRYLESQDFLARHAEMIANTASRQAFEKRFFRWLNAFRALKLIHHLTRERYPRRPLVEACVTLLSWMSRKTFESGSWPTEEELLQHFRALDRRQTAAR